MKVEKSKKKYTTPKLRKAGKVSKITLKTGSTTDAGDLGFV